MDIISLRLFFFDRELSRIEILQNNNEKIVAVRGKAEGAYRGFEFFQWSTAVKALSALLAFHAGSQGDSRLVGKVSAKSLAYAWFKAPAWIANLNFKKKNLLTVTNSHSDNAAFAVALYHGKLPNQAVQIYNENILLSGPACVEFANSLLNDQDFLISASTSKNLLEDLYYQEALTGLKHGLNLVKTDFDQVYNEFKFELEKLGYKSVKELNRLAQSAVMSEKVRIGLTADFDKLRDELCKIGGLQIAVPASAGSSLTLMTAVQDLLNLPILIDSGYVKALDIKADYLSQVLPNKTNALVLAQAPTLTLSLEDPRNAFEHLCNLPSQTHGLVVPQGNSLQNLRVKTIAEEFSTSLMFLSRAQRNHKNLNCQVTHADPIDIFLERQAGDLDSAMCMFFPFYRIYPTNEASIVISDQGSYIPAYLMLKKNILSSQLKYSLISAIRTVWYRLLEEPGLLLKYSKIVANSNSVQVMIRRISNI